jgi:Flp pilus assembly protein TadB
MLSDQERATLRDIEDRVLADDPSWARAFDATAARVSRQRAHETAFHVVAVLVWAVMAALMVAAGAPGPAVFFAALSGLSVWMIRRLRRPARDGTATGRTPA